MEFHAMACSSKHNKLEHCEHLNEMKLSSTEKRLSEFERQPFAKQKSGILRRLWMLQEEISGDNMNTSESGCDGILTK